MPIRFYQSLSSSFKLHFGAGFNRTYERKGNSKFFYRDFLCWRMQRAVPASSGCYEGEPASQALMKCRFKMLSTNILPNIAVFLLQRIITILVFFDLFLYGR